RVWSASAFSSWIDCSSMGTSVLYINRFKYVNMFYTETIMALSKQARGILEALLVSNGVSVVLFVLRLIATGSTQYWFLFWNLFLGWLPVLFAWLLIKQLRKSGWKKPIPILLTFLWLGFLPN